MTRSVLDIYQITAQHKAEHSSQSNVHQLFRNLQRHRALSSGGCIDFLREETQENRCGIAFRDNEHNAERVELFDEHSRRAHSRDTGDVAAFGTARAQAAARGKK